MTPYEGTLTKKLHQAVELSHRLSKWRQMTTHDALLEESILQGIIQQIELTIQQFDGQFGRYQNIAERRKQIAVDSEDSIKRLTDRLWEDSGYQFKSGTVAHDLLKVLCQKIQRFPLPDFPANRRKPLISKDVYLYEDSYTFLGQYFSWLIDLLAIIRFIPIRPPYGLDELHHKASQYMVLTQQVRQEAETLQTIQLTKVQLYKQLNKAMSAARGRLLVYKRQTRGIPLH